MSFYASNNRIRVTDNGATVFDTNDDIPHILGRGTYQVTVDFPDAPRRGVTYIIPNHHQEYRNVCNWQWVETCNQQYVCRNVCAFENVCSDVYECNQVCNYQTVCGYETVCEYQYSCSHEYDPFSDSYNYVCRNDYVCNQQHVCEQQYVCNQVCGYVQKCSDQYVCRDVCGFENVCTTTYQNVCAYEWVWVDQVVYDEDYLAYDWTGTYVLGSLPYNQNINFLLIKATAIRTIVGGTSQKPGDLASTVGSQTFAFQGSALLEATGKEDGSRFLSRIISVYPDNVNKELVLEAKHSNNTYPFVYGAGLGRLRSLASRFVITLDVYFGRFR